MPEPTPLEVIRSAIAGDTGAFRTIVEQNQAFAYAVAYRIVGDEKDAEDIVQEAFVRLWKNLPSYRPEIRLTTWFYTIITNLCLDLLKSAHRKAARETDDFKMTIVTDYSNPDKEMQQRELIEAVQLAAEKLTPKQKAVFVLRDLEGLGSDEVGHILSMSAGSIKSNLFYARQSVAKTLAQIYQTDKNPYLS